MKLSEFKTNDTYEREGVWVDIGSGTKLLLCRTGNPEYVAQWAKFTKPHKLAMRKGTMSDKDMEEVICKVLSRSVLLNWEGLEDDDGNEIEYSIAAAEDALAIKDFRALVVELAGNMETFKQQEVEDTLGN
jgi:hypothetical protein